MNRQRAVVGMSVALLAGATALGACAETKLGLGEECLKDTDCLSGVCAAQACADPGTLFTDASAVVVTPGPQAGPEAGPEAGSEADADSADGS